MDDKRFSSCFKNFFATFLRLKCFSVSRLSEGPASRGDSTGATENAGFTATVGGVAQW